LEIGGSHAHTLKPLIEKLGILCLIITDLDSMRLTEAKEEKVLPERDKAYSTNNDTLKKWVPQLTDLNALLDCKKNTTANGLIRVAYQNAIPITLNPTENPVEAIPYTFEDALALTNIDLFKEITGSKGLLKKIITALLKDDIKVISKDLFDCLSNSPKKAEMALDLLYLEDPSLLSTPQYIIDGLDWLQNELSKKDDDVISIVTNDGEKHE
jgi:predicted ATP-dependent endonuclease of OLD family